MEACRHMSLKEEGYREKHDMGTKKVSSSSVHTKSWNATVLINTSAADFGFVVLLGLLIVTLTFLDFSCALSTGLFTEESFLGTCGRSVVSLLTLKLAKFSSSSIEDVTGLLPRCCSDDSENGQEEAFASLVDDSKTKNGSSGEEELDLEEFDC